ncbi:MAG: phytanoyl-CoA dioxygenase family protein [Acidimicrobiia bacterium]|nr:phytanoyl-CoA dioxygenase family protein [Acidimicrobiia bacterium]MDH5236616.1 phytanoyl-CoA dioxygenase family protein [Acidimicrobiia bacterium]
MRAGADLVDAFQADGAVLVRGLADRRQLESLADAIDANRDAPGPYHSEYTEPGGQGGFWGDYCNWERFQAYRDFALQSGVAELVAGLMHSREVRFFHEHVLVKEPGTDEETPWHHDQPYYCVDGDQVCSVWLSLDDVPADHGLRFVVGSHRGGYHLPRRFLDAEPYWSGQDTVGFTPVPNIEGLARLPADHPDRPEITAFDVAAGDAIVFHMRTLHAAAGTPSLHRRRRAFTTRWLGDDAVYAIRPGPTSPPFPWLVERRPQPGTPLDHPEFPRAWPAVGV